MLFQIMPDPYRDDPPTAEPGRRRAATRGNPDRAHLPRALLGGHRGAPHRDRSEDRSQWACPGRRPIRGTTEWKKYTIDLADKNLSHIVGGFCWSASRDDNPNGFVIYLDEIRYEQ